MAEKQTYVINPTTTKNQGIYNTSIKSLEQLKQEYTDWRFGMFIHFNMSTFTDEEWAIPDHDPKEFNPVELDVRQWAKAAKSAGMTYAILTTKHHDGFCLWPSKYTDYNVMNSSKPVDIVKEYVDAFLEEGLIPCLYFSIWDRHRGIEEGVTREQMNFIKGQLTEILTNYGEVPMLIIDGWAWKMGHKDASYEEIRELVKRLQPNCLISDHNGLTEPWADDIVYYEEPKGVYCPADNTYAAHQGQTVSGDWFWHPDVPTKALMSLMDIGEHLTKLESSYCNFLLNCPANNLGKMDDNIVKLLSQIPTVWKPNTDRKPLPAQQETMEHPINPVFATATSGNDTALYAIDGISDVWNVNEGRETLWSSTDKLPASITIDLGKVYDNLNMLTYLPPKWTKDQEGTITAYTIYASTDGNVFDDKIASGKWDANNRLKIVKFKNTTARYVRLEALDAVNGIASVSELDIGSDNTTYPIPHDPDLIDSISYDGKLILEYQPDTLSYKVQVSSNDRVPVVNVVPKFPEIDITITQASSIPGTASIKATYGRISQEYSIQFACKS